MNARSRLDVLREMYQKDSTDSFVAYGLAMELARLPETAAESVRTFEKLLAEVPDYLPAYLQFGMLLVRQGEDSSARQVYQQGIALAQRQGERHTQEELEGALAML